MLSDIYDRIVR